jgi:MOSC domain-containing protein YiiM
VKLVSVNVGMPREIVWQEKSVTTSIFKHPVAGPVALRRLNLDGDKQSDLTVHGGPDKAVYGYAFEHYAYWKRELPDADLTPGAFGENLTTDGLDEHDLSIGDVVQVGTATLMVTQPRVPCFKLAAKFGRPDMVKRFAAARRSGFYFEVLAEGAVAAGDPIAIVERAAERMSVAELNDLYFSKEVPKAEVLHRALRLRGLAEVWRREIAAIVAKTAAAS